MSKQATAGLKAPETKKETASPQRQRPGSSSSCISPYEQVINLQRFIGNQGVQRLLEGGGNQRSTLGDHIQAKLMIGQPNDIYEQEADRVANQVMRMPETTAISDQPKAMSEGKEGIQLKPGRPFAKGPAYGEEKILQQKPLRITPLIQRQAEEDEEELVQMKREEGGTTSLTSSLESSITSLNGGGKPLSDPERAYFEHLFGTDFSNVRLHEGNQAGGLAEKLRAKAFTVGGDIVFGSGEYSPNTAEGGRLLAHELTHVVQRRGSTLPSVQRKCHADELGSPIPDCKPSQQGVAGWLFIFKAGCDELLPGEKTKISKLKVGSKLSIHGFAIREGDPDFSDRLSCHRANKIAELARAQRADCPVVGTFKHVSGPEVALYSVIIEEVKPTPESGELWLDPSGIFINKGWALYNRAQHNPTRANLDIVAKHRLNLMFWLEETPKEMAPAGVKLSRQNLDDYRRFYASAEKLWTAIDQLLALQKHPSAVKDMHEAWASMTGERSKSHAKSVPVGAKYHIDIFGEGYYPGAINIGMAERSETTQPGAKVPNLIYRRFSHSAANHIPIADHVADLVTAESGPIEFPGLIAEISRIIAPGGTIVLYGPKSLEQYHNEVAKVTGGKITKKLVDKTGLESKTIVPSL